jgi:hypothetical protein
MDIEIRPVNPSFVAEIGGIDLSRSVDRPAVDAIWAAINLYAVLVFRDQRLDDTQLRDFAAHFGPLEIGRAAARGGRRRLAHPEIGDISNLDEDGRLRQRDDGRRLDSLGNRLWHTDASYMPVPVVLGMLHAVTVPPASALGGGETEFADMRGAYDALSEALKAERRARRRTRRLLVARPDRLYRVSARRARAVPAVAAAAGTPSSRLATQDALSLGARLAHRRLAGSRGASATPRSQHPRHPTGIRLPPQVAGWRSCDLGQPLHDASRPSTRRFIPARPAPRDDTRCGLDLRRSGLG